MWARHAHLAERQALRSGHVPSSLVLGGRRVKVERPRARSIEGHEQLLPSDRECVQPRARYRAASKALAGWHDDSEMDRDWRT
jgi:hypothetical protein